MWVVGWRVRRGSSFFWGVKVEGGGRGMEVGVEGWRVWVWVWEVVVLGGWWGVLGLEGGSVVGFLG